MESVATNAPSTGCAAKAVIDGEPSDSLRQPHHDVNHGATQLHKLKYVRRKTCVTVSSELSP